MENGNGFDVYQMVTDRILELLEKGVVPWKHFASNPNTGLPMNLVTKKPYRGLNTFLLMSAGFQSPYWLSFKQCKERGGYVRKGEQSQVVVFWKILKKEVEDEVTKEKKIKKVFFIRYSRVFNVEQCEGLKGVPTATADERSENDIINAAQSIVENMPNRPVIRHTRKAVAYYSPAKDEVTMCERRLCKSSSQYYTTLLHELVHSTGHKSRLNRFEEEKQATYQSMGGKASYAAEELIAEMGAAMLSAQCGLFQDEEQNMASYISGWLKALQNDRKMVVYAAARAQKAADYINPAGTIEDEDEETE